MIHYDIHGVLLVCSGCITYSCISFNGRGRKMKTRRLTIKRIPAAIDWHPAGWGIFEGNRRWALRYFSSTRSAELYLEQVHDGSGQAYTVTIDCRGNS